MRERGVIAPTPGSSEFYDEEIEQTVSFFRSIQSHNCAKGHYRCMEKTDNLEKPVCRVPKYPHSIDYGYKEVKTNHSQEVLEGLQNLGSAHFDEVSMEFVFDEVFQGGKMLYTTDWTDHLSPTNALLFHLTRSSTNLHIWDRHLSAKYIAKYAAGMDARAEVWVKPGSEESSLKIESDEVRNEKIARVKATIKSKNKTNSSKHNLATGRIVCLTDMMWWSLKFPYVATNVEFVHVSTHAKEYRAGDEKNARENNSTASTHS